MLEIDPTKLSSIVEDPHHHPLKPGDDDRHYPGINSTLAQDLIAKRMYDNGISRSSIEEFCALVILAGTVLMLFVHLFFAIAFKHPKYKTTWVRAQR